MELSVFLGLSSSLLAGCGATTVRAAVAPTIDTEGHPGVESTFSFGIGTPLDFSGRSHHYLQALGSIGGGLDGRSGGGEVVAAVDLDYLYWAEPGLDVRAGLRSSYRGVEGGLDLRGFGGHIGFLPLVRQAASNWIVPQLAIGPELQMEYVWGDPTRPSRGIFSAPLVVEVNFLAAGD